MKLIYSFLFLFFVIFSFVNADPLVVDSLKPVYKLGETYQAFLNYNTDFVGDITVNNFEFRRNNTKVPVALSFFDLGNRGFLYFDIPSNIDEDNYSLVIKDLFYLDDGVLVQSDFTKEINLTFDSFSSISLNPGVIIVNSIWDENIFTVTIENKGASDISLNISSPDYILLSDDSIELTSQEAKTFEVYVDAFDTDKEEGFINLTYGNDSYSVPVLLSFIETDTENTGGEYDLRFLRITMINQTIFENETISGPLSVKNYGNYSLEGLVFSVSDSLSGIIGLNLTRVSINPGETLDQYIWINGSGVENGTYSGNIYLANNLVQISLPIYIEVLKGESNNKSLLSNTNLNYTKILDNNKTKQPDTVEKNYSLLWYLFVFIVITLFLIAWLYYRGKREGNKEEITPFD